MSHTATRLNATHDPEAKSWVTSANRPGNDFPIQNLPFAVFRHRNSQEAFRGGIAIGDQVLDLWDLHRSGLLKGLAYEAAEAGAQDSLNDLMTLGPAAWSALRHAVFELLHTNASAAVQQQVGLCLEAQAEVVYALPAHIGDYTDFYTSIYHATNIGKLFRPDHPLLPNYTWVPIGYHGRSSSIQVSGHRFPRPSGQVLPPGASEPVFSACKRLDWEVELGVFIGTGNALGQPIPLAEAESHVFGVCLLNDWSARDIQAWEYQPLGPFLAKNFASTLSPWIVTMEALAPYRTALERPDGKATDLAYLHSEHNRQQGALDIHISMGLRTATMRDADQADHEVSRSNYRHAYWTLAQMVTHHTVNGCNLQAGDLLGTGTLSGPESHSAGALIELTQGGKVALNLPNGETRTFLQDGDEAVMRAWCERAGAARIGFGECRATVLPAV
jgi:fumarylacetoacetase